MSLSADNIIARIMERAMDASSGTTVNALRRYHVSQTADQLPDFKIRNAFYRSELEKQIQDKRDAERRRKERDAQEEERMLLKIEAERERLQLEYMDEIERRRLLQDEAAKKQLAFAKKYEEIKGTEERKRLEEAARRRQEAAIEKRIAELKEAFELRKAEELEVERRRQKLLYEKLYGYGYGYGSSVDTANSNVVKRPWNNDSRDPDFLKRPWNSRDYVHSAFNTANLALEDVYFEAPLPLLADVYKKLDSEKRRIKEIMRQRIIQGDTLQY